MIPSDSRSPKPSVEAAKAVVSRVRALPEYVLIPIGKIVLPEDQPRETFDERSHAALTQSIREHNVLVPLLVVAVNDGSYLLIAGERRWCAAMDAGLELVPAIVLDETEPAMRWLLSLIENVQRENLRPMELARALARCLRDTGMTHAELAAQLGRGRDFVEEHLALLRLPVRVQRLIESGQLTKHHARVLRHREPEEQIRLAEQAAGASLSAVDLKRLAPRRPRESSELPEGNGHQKITKELEQLLGCRVTLRMGTHGAGRLEIGYEDSAELTRLVSVLRCVGERLGGRGNLP
jgi:ParB family chromosome partitioning protein